MFLTYAPQVEPHEQAKAPPPTVTKVVAESPPSEPEWLTFTATAYVADCDGCIGITRTGIDVKHTQVDEEGRRIIAVDPAVIALGTTLDIRIENDEGTTEIIEAVAADTGGAIDGREIDVLMATEDDAIDFGRRDVQIRVIKR